MTRLCWATSKLVTKLSRVSATADCGRTVTRPLARKSNGDVCMASSLIQSRRPTYACAHENCAHARQSHCKHAGEPDSNDHVLVGGHAIGLASFAKTYLHLYGLREV
eukprot:6191125-Pleurochrysis_carterae.AAC.1